MVDVDLIAERTGLHPDRVRDVLDQLGKPDDERLVEKVAEALEDASVIVASEDFWLREARAAVAAVRAASQAEPE